MRLVDSLATGDGRETESKTDSTHSCKSVSLFFFFERVDGQCFYVSGLIVCVCVCVRVVARIRPCVCAVHTFDFGFSHNINQNVSTTEPLRTQYSANALIEIGGEICSMCSVSFRDFESVIRGPFAKTVSKL